MDSIPVKEKNSWLTRSNGITALLAVFLISMTIFPGVKAFVIRGLMKAGFFKPSITVEKKFSPSPDIVFGNVDDSLVTLASLKGKTVFINIWATWCSPCIAEMPGINELYNKVGNDRKLVFIMVDADADFNKSGKFMRDHHYDLPLYKMNGSLPQTVFSGTLPTTLVINKYGEIVFREEGVANYATEKFKNFLEQLVAQ